MEWDFYGSAVVFPVYKRVRRMDEARLAKYAAWRTEAERRRRLAAEPPVTARLPDKIDVAAIRRRLSCGFSYAAISQADFARRFGFSPAAVRDWEQGRRKPEASARVLLMLIADQPHLVDEAIKVALDGRPAEPAELPPG